LNVSTSDSLCFTLNQAKFLLSSTEKYVLLDSLNKINEEEILLLTEIVKEKDVQNQLHQSTLHGLRNEVTKLRRQRTFLSVGLGGALVAIIVLLVP